MRHSYKLALRAKGIKPLPPYNQLRSAKSEGDREIFNPAIAVQGQDPRKEFRNGN